MTSAGTNTAIRHPAAEHRHYSLFVPRDFDISPYFDVVKPTLAAWFDHRVLEWADRPAAAARARLDVAPLTRAA